MKVLLLLSILAANFASVVGQVTTTTDAGVVHVKSSESGGKCEGPVTLSGTVTYEYEIDIDLIDTFVDLPIETILNSIKPDPVTFDVSATVPQGKTGTLYAEIELEKAVSNNYISVFGVNILWAKVTVTGPKGEPTGVIRDLKDLDCRPTSKPTNRPTLESTTYTTPLGFDLNNACERMSTIRCHRPPQPPPPSCFHDLFAPGTGLAPLPPSTLDECDIEKIKEWLKDQCPPEEECETSSSSSTGATPTGGTESSTSGTTSALRGSTSTTEMTSTSNAATSPETSSTYTTSTTEMSSTSTETSTPETTPTYTTSTTETSFTSTTSETAYTVTATNPFW